MENDHNVGVSGSGLVEEHPKVRVYGYSNRNHSSSSTLNVMRKCQPTGQMQFLPQICNNTLQLRLHRCLTCFNGMSEERTDYADLICATKPEKSQRELPFRQNCACVSLSFFFLFQTPAFNVTNRDLQRDPS